MQSPLQTFESVSVNQAQNRFNHHSLSLHNHTKNRSIAELKYTAASIAQNNPSVSSGARGSNQNSAYGRVNSIKNHHQHNNHRQYQQHTS